MVHNCGMCFAIYETVLHIMNDFTRKMVPLYSLYYQASVVRTTSWFVVAILKSFDHVSLDRTIDVQNSIFEFFVPHAMEAHFLEIMNELIKQGYVFNLQKMENRLLSDLQQV